MLDVLTENYLVIWTTLIICFFVYIFKWDIENLIKEKSGKNKQAEISNKEKMKEKLSSFQSKVDNYLQLNPNQVDEIEKKNQQRIQDEIEMLKSLSKRKPPKMPIESKGANVCTLDKFGRGGGGK
eukprot:TRINITY_DN7157_c0_g1_i3.p1 TRINITY_DN7157_c0_g1~~TRINITY_DN7157_c0_g1_i3.p1  ORF type:complete len:125 (-),score=35.27 TRINITY_DN7157_c0_g1_i3:332-706(-)